MTALILALTGPLAANAQAEAASDKAKEKAAAPAKAAADKPAEAAEKAPAAEPEKPAEAVAAPAETPKPTGPDAIAAEADAMYAKREIGGKGKNIDGGIKLLEEATEAHPDSYALWWRLSRAYWWKADGLSGDKKSELGLKGKAAGDKARELEPKKVEGHYFAALGVGAWSQGISIVSALTKGAEGKFNDRLDASIKIDPKYVCSGPLISKGRYFFELPWPKYDDEESEKYLTQAIKNCPKNVRAHAYLAELYWEEDEDEKGDAAIEKALAIKPGSFFDPPEARRSHKYAEKMKKKHAED